ncbi:MULTISPECIES: hypothetical protein [Lysobacteraceae]|uniref:hypothetical protein n=1 Tax=Lysobacteraceae TaxID=32033 RepID=UPI0024468353|nr:hypothetical protein [Stenotrophomonas maltophilia]MDH0740967.1 hypothetical protein [Stenotrophomonas maltophilia]MDH1328403.1 hypothetical protein [Stenotrophomonas maltophilia]
MPATSKSCTVQPGTQAGPATALGREATVVEALERLRADPIRARDIGFALRLADEVAPSPAAAHTALLVLRNLVAELAGLTTVEEQKLLTAAWQ